MRALRVSVLVGDVYPLPDENLEVCGLTENAQGANPVTQPPSFLLLPSGEESLTLAIHLAISRSVFGHVSCL